MAYYGTPSGLGQVGGYGWYKLTTAKWGSSWKWMHASQAEAARRAGYTVNGPYAVKGQ